MTRRLRSALRRLARLYEQPQDFLAPYFRAAGFGGPPAVVSARLRDAGWPVYASREEAEAVAAVIRASDLFDARAYARRLGRLKRVDPAVHYVVVGERMGIPPSDRFDPTYYRHRYPDVAETRLNCLAHYLACGREEGRRGRSLASSLRWDPSRVDAARDTVLVVVPDASRTNAAVVAHAIARSLRRRHNVVAFLLAGGEMVANFEASCNAVIGPLADWDAIEAQYLVGWLCASYGLQLAIVNGLESRLALPALAYHLVPAVTIVHEFPSPACPEGAAGRAFDWSTRVVFSADDVADAARRAHPALAARPIHVLPPGPSDLDGDVSELEAVGCAAVHVVRQRTRDFDTIRADRLFDADFYIPPDYAWISEDWSAIGRDEAIAGFLTRWTAIGLTRRVALNRLFRRPCPGFHPEIYAHDNAGRYDAATVNPFADFIRRGKPGGPWCSELIRPAPTHETSRRLRTLLHVHFHYPELAGDFMRKLAATGRPCDLLLTTDTDAKAATVRGATVGYVRGRVEIRVVPNVGRDLAPLLTGLATDVMREYELIGHLHAKRSLHSPRLGDPWREFLWENLLGGRHPMLDVIVDRFAVDTTLGLVFAADPHLADWASNLPLAAALAERMGIDGPLPPFFDFPIGTMFWARPEALRPLVDLELGWADYPEEPVAVDGTILHALERLLPFAASRAGYRFATTCLPGVTW